MVLVIFRTYGFAIRFFDSWRLINAKAVLFQRLLQDKEKRDRVRKSVESRVANILEGLPVPLQYARCWIHSRIKPVIWALGIALAIRNVMCLMCCFTLIDCVGMMYIGMYMYVIRAQFSIL